MHPEETQWTREIGFKHLGNSILQNSRYTDYENGTHNEFNTFPKQQSRQCHAKKKSSLQVLKR